MSVRYLATVAITAFLTAVFAGLAGAAIPALGPLLLVLAALALYGAGLALDVVPPGRPPRVALPVRAKVRRPSREFRLVAAIAAVLGFGLLGATAFGSPPPTPTLEALPASGDSLTTDVAAAEPQIATPTAEPPTAAAVEPSPEPTATPAEPTVEPSTDVPDDDATPATSPVALEASTEPPSPTPTPDPIVAETQALQAGWLTGRWQVTNTAASGAGAGESATLVLDLHEAAGQVEGSGDGITIAGVRQGPAFSLIFRRSDGTGGRYDWTMRPDGSLAGSFIDDATGNSGPSTAHRLPD